MHALYDFVLVADADLRLDDWEILSDNEVYPLSEVFTTIPWRPGTQVLFSAWNRRLYTLRRRGQSAEKNSPHILWQEDAGTRLLADGAQVIERNASDLGFTYQISLSQLAHALGLPELCRRQAEVIRLQPRDASEIAIPSEPYFLRLSPDTLYFHDALVAYFLLLDCLFLNRWGSLHVKNVVIHPAMTSPETKALGLLLTIDWICAARGMALFVVTLDPGSFKYLRHAQFIESCENYMHRRRTADYAITDGTMKYDTFMAWDAGWSPESKGLPLVLEAFREQRIERPLVLKVPDGYPNESADSRAFFEMVKRYQEWIDVRLVQIPGGREGLLEAMWRHVEVLIHAGRSDVGPRIVFEAMGMNKKVLFLKSNDCNLVRHGMLDGVAGFRTFNEHTLGQMLDELDGERSETARFFERHDWRHTRDLFRERTADASIRGFWMECHLILDTDKR